MKQIFFRSVGLIILMSMGLAISCRTRHYPVSVMLETTEANPVRTPQEAVRVAESYAYQMKFQIGSRQQPRVKRCTTPENDIVDARYPSEYKDRIRAALEGKVYWMVYYPSEASRIGGDYAFFIDEMTGSVLAHYAGR